MLRRTRSRDANVSSRAYPFGFILAPPHRPGVKVAGDRYRSTSLRICDQPIVQILEPCDCQARWSVAALKVDSAYFHSDKAGFTSFHCFLERASAARPDGGRARCVCFPGLIIQVFLLLLYNYSIRFYLPRQLHEQILCSLP